MAGRVGWVEAGLAGDRRLLDLVRDLQGGDPLAPVWVGIHSSVAGLHLRRFFASEGAYAGVRFAPLSRLAEMLGAPLAVGDGRQPLGEAALRAACRRELLSLREGGGRSWLGPVADHESTEEALARTWRAARLLDPAILGRVGRLGGRAREVAQLLVAVSDRLSPYFFDAEELVEEAAGALERGVADLDGVGPVVLYGLDPPSQRMIRFLEALAGRTSVAALLRLAGDELADRALFATAARLGEHGFAVPKAPQVVFERREVDVLSVPDEDEEVRAAVRLLMAHAEGGGDLGRCVVTFPHDVSDVSLVDRLADQLRRADVPFGAYGGTALGTTPEGRLLTGLVALACQGDEEPSLERGAVLAWLRSGPVRVDRGIARGLTGLVAKGALASQGLLAVGRIDRCSSAAGVAAGVEQWRARLGAYSRRQPERWEPGAPGPAAAELAVLAERLSGLLSAARAAERWSELAAWSTHALEELLVPSDTRDALAEAVGTLSALDPVEPLDRLTGRQRCERLRGALSLVLGRPAGGVGRFGTGPLVGSLHAVAGVASELTIVLGCREGTLPARVSDDPLLPPSDLERAGGSAELERSDERDRRDFLAVIAASDSVVTSWPRVDLSVGREVLPSRWLNTAPLAPRNDAVASFAKGLGRVASGESAAADEADLELASLAAMLAGGAPPTVPAHPVLRRSRLAERVEAERVRRRPGLSRFAGDLRRAGLGDPGPDTGSLFGSALSPTTLESFAMCPFRHFLDHVLRLAPLEAPEEVATIGARERGTLIHDVLERYFRPDPEAAPAVPPPFDDAQLERLRALAEEAFAQVESQGKTGKVLFWRIERGKIRRDLERFVAIETERARSTHATPVAVELSFGRGDEAPIVIRAAGRDVAFRGQIDRVDREPDGSVVVIDYKSGSSEAYKDIERDALGQGRHLQLPIYAKAARERFAARPCDPGPAQARLRAEYRFVSSEASFGVVQVELTRTLDAALSEVLGILVSTVDAGCFPPNPGPLERFGHANCGWCDFDDLCPTDRGDLWREARQDPALDAYVHLVEPDGVRS